MYIYSNIPNSLSSLGTLILLTSISTPEKPGSKISALVSPKPYFYALKMGTGRPVRTPYAS